MYELLYSYHMNKKIGRNYVTCHFREFYFETNFGEIFRTWNKSQRTPELHLQTGVHGGTYKQHLS